MVSARDRKLTKNETKKQDCTSKLLALRIFQMLAYAQRTLNIAIKEFANAKNHFIRRFRHPLLHPLIQQANQCSPIKVDDNAFVPLLGSDLFGTAFILHVFAHNGFANFIQIRIGVLLINGMKEILSRFFIFEKKRSRMEQAFFPRKRGIKFFIHFLGSS